MFVLFVKGFKVGLVACASLLVLALAACQGASVPATAPAVNLPTTTVPATTVPATTLITAPATAPVTTPVTVPATQPQTAPSTAESTLPATAPETEPSAMPVYLNPLTGLPIAEDKVNNRPVALMVGNAKGGLPQEGISAADVIYETLTEGGQTRLMALFTDYAAIESIGSMRSAREYFISFAQDYDAIFVHHGAADTAFEQIRERDIDNLEGIYGGLEGITFFRDAVRRQELGYAHSMMVTGEGLVKGIARKKYRTTTESSFPRPLQFADETYELDGQSAVKVKVEFSSYCISDFEYDPETKLYSKFHYKGIPHVDALYDNQQLTFTNLIVLGASIKPIEGDTEDHVSVGIIGSGDGYYITGGKMIPIRWEKTAHESPMKFTTTDGEALKLNPGKTYVGVTYLYYYRNFKVQ